MATDNINSLATDSPLSAIQEHLDARLLILGRLLEITASCNDSVLNITANLQENAENKDYYDVYDAMESLTCKLVEQIAIEKAKTPDGLKIKAKAFAWVSLPEPIDSSLFDDVCLSTRIANSIVRDLLH
jgi:hypothetical protein